MLVVFALIVIKQYVDDTLIYNHSNHPDRTQVTVVEVHLWLTIILRAMQEMMHKEARHRGLKCRATVLFIYLTAPENLQYLHISSTDGHILVTADKLLFLFSVCPVWVRHYMTWVYMMQQVCFIFYDPHTLSDFTLLDSAGLTFFLYINYKCHVSDQRTESAFILLSVTATELCLVR